MNKFYTITTKEFNTSKTLETLIIFNEEKNRVFHIYNYEGVHFRLFLNQVNVEKFLNHENAYYLDFDHEKELEEYLQCCSL